MFVIQLLQRMKLSVKLSVTEKVYNIGAIFMTGKITITSSTKHVDVRYKYDNEYMEDW